MKHSFPLQAVRIDSDLPRQCGTCSLWQANWKGGEKDDKGRSRCACPTPASVIRHTLQSDKTYESQGEHCSFWHPVDAGANKQL